MAHEGLEFLDLFGGRIHTALRLPDHGFERSGAFPLAKTLHCFLGQTHFVAEALGFLDEKLRRRLGGLGGLLHEHAQVFVGVAVGQFRGKIRIGRPRDHIDQSRQFAVSGFDHGGNSTGCRVGRHFTVFFFVPFRRRDEGGVLGQFEALRHARGHGVAVERLDDRVDHVDGADLVVAHGLQAVVEHLLFLLLDEEHGAGAVEGLLATDEEDAEDRAEKKAEADQPPLLHDDVEVLAPIERLGGLLQRVERVGWQGVVHDFCLEPALFDCDDVARLDFERVGFAVGHAFGVGLDRLHFPRLLALDDDASAIGDAGETSG